MASLDQLETQRRGQIRNPLLEPSGDRLDIDTGNALLRIDLLINVLLGHLSRLSVARILASMVIDVTDATFPVEVIERSATVPVVVDLWAPWCGPCRTLTPILEEVIGNTNGQVVLAKVNVDENPQTSAALQVRGIPAVFAFKDGRPVAQFVGAQGMGFVQEFVDRLLPTEQDLELARLIEQGDEESLRAALELVPDHAAAIVALAELLVNENRSEEALEVLARIPETVETKRVAALARTSGSVGDDIEARLEALLDEVKGNDDARQEFLDLLEVLGPDHPRTADYRKALTARLF